MTDRAIIGHSGKLISPAKEKIHSVAVQTDTIHAKFIESCLKHSEKPALIYKKDHTFGYIQYKRLLNLVENFTLSLQRLGVKKGDRVALISENRPEWVVSDLSVKSLGAILVPVHKVASVEQTKAIIYEIEPALIIVSDSATLLRAKQINKSLNKKIPIVYLEVDDIVQKIVAHQDRDFISALKLVAHGNHSGTYQSLASNVEPSQVSAIIYTPSPKGGFKGTQLTHQNFISNVFNTKQAIEIRKKDRFLSVLPLSHAFEKTAGYYVPLFSGSTISYLSELSHFSETVKTFKPTVIVGVPRLYEKTYQKTMEKIGKNRLKRYFANKAFSGEAENRPKRLSAILLDRLIFSKVRSSLGGKVRFLVSGGAALKPEIGRFFYKAGVPLLEGYGLTETAPIVSVNRLDDYKLGTVGKPLPNVHVRIADDGEILVKGLNVTPGYFRNFEKVDKINGWLKTGDYGEMDDEGFLKITGKKKDIIVLSTGKNVSPSAIKKQLVKSDYIKRAIIVGDGEKHISARIVPDNRKLKEVFPQIKKEALCNIKEVRAFFKKEINRLLEGFPHHEQVKKFTFIA